jgi:hypothetical protein
MALRKGDSGRVGSAHRPVSMEAGISKTSLDSKTKRSSADYADLRRFTPGHGARATGHGRRISDSGRVDSVHRHSHPSDPKTCSHKATKPQSGMGKSGAFHLRGFAALCENHALKHFLEDRGAEMERPRAGGGLNLRVKQKLVSRSIGGQDAGGVQRRMPKPRMARITRMNEGTVNRSNSCYGCDSWLTTALVPAAGRATGHEDPPP